jgi:hypothetical protein
MTHSWLWKHGFPGYLRLLPAAGKMRISSQRQM